MPRQENPHRSDDRIDALLRDTLEPDPETVDRLVAKALAGRQEPAAGSRRWPASPRRWQLAMAAAIVALAIMTLPIVKPWLPPMPSSGTTREQPAEPGKTSAPRAHGSLRISNEDGPVTVTSPAGSKMVFLSRVAGP